MSTGSHNSDNQNSRILGPGWVSHTHVVQEYLEARSVKGLMETLGWHISTEARVANPKSLDLLSVFLVKKGLGTVRFPRPESQLRFPLGGTQQCSILAGAISSLTRVPPASHCPGHWRSSSWQSPAVITELGSTFHCPSECLPKWLHVPQRNRNLLTAAFQDSPLSSYALHSHVTKSAFLHCHLQ